MTQSTRNGLKLLYVIFAFVVVPLVMAAFVR